MLVTPRANIECPARGQKLRDVKESSLSRGQGGIGPVSREDTRGGGPDPALLPAVCGDDSLEQVESPIRTAASTVRA